MKPVIELFDVSKKFLRSSGRQDSFAGTIANGFDALFSRNTSVKQHHWALRDINFSVEPGEILGIIGKNGSGKSTLLRIISEIISPTSGKVEVNGTISPLLDIGSGFHPDLTGRDNVFMNGALLGMSSNDIRLRLDDIIDFSGIGHFIDSPVKHYSNGMFLRLGFSIAAHLVSDIILIDEVLAVGDSEFQYRSMQKVREMASSGKTLVVVSHGMNSINNLCEKAILLQGGRLIAKDSPVQIISTYLSENQEAIDKDLAAEAIHRFSFNPKAEDGIKGIVLHDVSVIVDNRDNNHSYYIQDSLGVSFNLTIEEPLNDLQLMIQITRNHDSIVILTTNELLGLNPTVTLNQTGVFNVSCLFPKYYFNRGLYSVSVCLKSPFGYYFENNNILSFFVQLPELEARDTWLKDSNFNSGPIPKWDMKPV